MFSRVAEFPLKSNQPRDGAIGDFNGDGITDIAPPGRLAFLFNQREMLLVDVNLDGKVNLLNISVFTDLVLSDQFQSEAEINQDGSVDLLEVLLFSKLLQGG